MVALAVINSVTPLSIIPAQIASYELRQSSISLSEALPLLLPTATTLRLPNQKYLLMARLEQRAFKFLIACQSLMTWKFFWYHRSFAKMKILAKSSSTKLMLSFVSTEVTNVQYK
jgi:hypothetical protein